jgi:hypothetical protein
VTWRHVIAYWALALALAGWLYADSRTSATPPVDPETAVAPLVAPPLERFDEVVLARGADRFVFRRKDGRWTQSASDAVTVPSDLVAALLDTLSTIPPIERLASESSTAPEFGLAPAETRIELRSGGATALEIDIGRRNPTRTAAYAAVAGKPAVYLIGLNAQYYLELIFDEITRQRSSRAE